MVGTQYFVYILTVAGDVRSSSGGGSVVSNTWLMGDRFVVRTPSFCLRYICSLNLRFVGNTYI